MTDDDALHHLKESCYCSSCQRAIEHLRSALLSHAEVVKERDGLRAQLELIHPEAGHLAHAEAYTKLESENYALRAEVVTLKQEISGNDSAHRLLLAEVERLKEQLQYPDPEDMPGELAAKYCPFKDPLHFHHDGCPSEWAVETRAKKAEAELAAARPLLEAVEDMHQANDGHYATAIERRFVSREEIAILRAAYALKGK